MSWLIDRRVLRWRRVWKGALRCGKEVSRWRWSYREDKVCEEKYW